MATKIDSSILSWVQSFLGFNNTGDNGAKCGGLPEQSECISPEPRRPSQISVSSPQVVDNSAFVKGVKTTWKPQDPHLALSTCDYRFQAENSQEKVAFALCGFSAKNGGIKKFYPDDKGDFIPQNTLYENLASPVECYAVAQNPLTGQMIPAELAQADLSKNLNLRDLVKKTPPNQRWRFVLYGIPSVTYNSGSTSYAPEVGALTFAEGGKSLKATDPASVAPGSTVTIILPAAPWDGSKDKIDVQLLLGTKAIKMTDSGQTTPVGNLNIYSASFPAPQNSFPNPILAYASQEVNGKTHTTKAFLYGPPKIDTNNSNTLPNPIGLSAPYSAKVGQAVTFTIPSAQTNKFDYYLTYPSSSGLKDLTYTGPTQLTFNSAGQISVRAYVTPKGKKTSVLDYIDHNITVVPAGISIPTLGMKNAPDAVKVKSSFTIEVENPDTTNWNYEWRFSDGKTSTNTKYTHSGFTTTGAKTVVLRATSKANSSTVYEIKHNITVVGLGDPVPGLTITPAGGKVNSNDQLTVTADFSTTKAASGAKITGYEIDWGEGLASQKITAGQTSVNHTYSCKNSTCSRTVKLTVKQDNGSSASVTLTLSMWQ